MHEYIKVCINIVFATLTTILQLLAQLMLTAPQGQQNGIRAAGYITSDLVENEPPSSPAPTETIQKHCLNIELRLW